MNKYQAKAQELFQVFYFPHYKFNNETGTSVIDEKMTKQVQLRCALIAVDELIANEHLEVGDASFWEPVKDELLKM